MSQTSCVNHPNRPSVENCEVCGKSLCAYCLYYTDDGQRLCEEHAFLAQTEGIEIFSPKTYAAELYATQMEHEHNPPKRRQAMYQANNPDVIAYTGMITAGVTLIGCCGTGFCFMALPPLSFGLGVAGLLNASDAAEPRRARQQAWVATLIGGFLSGIMLLCIVAFIVGQISLSSIVNSNFSNTNIVFTPQAFPTSVTPSPTIPPTIDPTLLPDNLREPSQTPEP